MLLAFHTALEVLHLVEFYLEDGITDEEAVALIDLEAPGLHKRENKWQEMTSDRILLIKIGEKSNDFYFLPPGLKFSFFHMTDVSTIALCFLFKFV